MSSAAVSNASGPHGHSSSSRDRHHTSAPDEAAGFADNRIFPSPSTDQIFPTSSGGGGGGRHSHHRSSSQPEEGVEVVLEGTSGKTNVMESTRSSSEHNQDQNVFRAPHPVRPRAIRGGRPPMVHGSGSYGYGPHDYRPYPVSYGPSGSFEDGYSGSGNGGHPVPSHSSSSSHYSPHGQYPSHGSTSRPTDDVNVISPNQKDHSPHHPVTPRSSGSNGGRYGGPGAPPHSSHSHGSHSTSGGGSYQYPPTSPVKGSVSGSSSSRGQTSPPRMRGYHSMRRGGAGGSDPAYPTPDRSRPPLVTESSFDSEHYSSHASYSSHPTTPSAPHYGSSSGGPGGPHPPSTHSSDHHYPGYGSFEGGSFDAGHHPPPPSSSSHSYYDDRYYGHSPSHPHSEGHSPYSPAYSYGYSPSGSSGYYDPYSPHGHHYGGGRYPRSYDEHDRYHGGYPYHHGAYPPHPHHHPYSPHDPYGHHHHYGDHHHHDGRKKDEKSGMLLPAAASEVEFDITDPPMEPSTPPSTQPVCDSPGDVNSYDVLCGRGGGTNSQIGNRRFRKLVQEFQPIYLLARRKEKPLLARTIVLIIRKRGGRFLKKDDETGELFEVGDPKAEAKTSQALREGLDVRATKSAASSLLDKKKKKKQEEEKEKLAAEKSGDVSVTSPGGASAASAGESSKSAKDEEKKDADKDVSVSSSNGRSRSPQVGERRTERPPKTESPPSLPNLHGQQDSSSKDGSSSGGSPTNAPPSPEQIQFRKRRRMRSTEGVEAMPSTGGGCAAGLNPFSGDKLFPDFCPPRADLHRASSPTMHDDDDPMEIGTTPIPANASKFADDDIRYEHDTPGASSAAGCAGIALDMMTGAAAGSFCLGPRQWR